MSIGDGFDPHRRNQARLVVQGAVGPFDRLFEAPRGEVSDSDIKGGDVGQRIEWAQTARPLARFDCRVGLVARRVDTPSGQPGVSGVRVERQGAIDLKEIGVAAVGDRRRLLEAIASLGGGALPAAPAVVPSAVFGEAERRQLTVMFCDLVGSTPLSVRFVPACGWVMS